MGKEEELEEWNRVITRKTFDHQWEEDEYYDNFNYGGGSDEYIYNEDDDE